MMRHVLYLVPIVIFATLVGFFSYRLVLIARGQTPDMIPSAMIGKPAPEFDLLPVLTDKPGLKTADLKGKVTLINFFASWCEECQAEHPLLSTITSKGAVLVGITYKDHADKIKNWLAKADNPYDAIGDDAKGRVAIDFGLYGVPETYVIDKHGIIRFRHPGPLTPRIIREELMPLIKELNK